MNKHPNEQPETPGVILCRFYQQLRENGVTSYVHVAEDSTTQSHIKIKAVPIKISLTVTASTDGQLVIMTADQNRRIHAAPDAALDIITALAKKEPA